VSAVPTAPVPAVPGGFTAVPGAKQVTLSWNASSNATEYELERSATAVGGYSVVTMITGTSVTSYSYTDTGRITGKTYYYEVIALNTTYGTTSGPSAPISIVA
jgi:hypothetical protein